jgi:hypothetical protein
MQSRKRGSQITAEENKAGNNNSPKVNKDMIYSGTSVHELNSFLEAVREPKLS